MKIKKRFLYISTLGATLVPISSAISCGTDSEKSKDIAMILSTQNNPYFVTLKKAAEKEAKKLGYKLDIFVSENDQNKEADKIDLVISQGYKVLVLNGLDSTQSAAAAKRAIDKGIKVIAVDRALDKNAKVWTTISSANKKGAKDLATKTLDFLKSKSITSLELLHLQGISGEQNGIDRWKGVSEAKDAYTSLTISKIYEQRADYDRTKGQTKTSTAMTSNPNIKWINADNDEMALGAIAALGKKAGNQVFVTGFDGGTDAVNAVNAGTMYGTVKQDAAGIGVASIHAAIEANGGKDYDGITKGEPLKVPVIVITKDNVANYK